MNLREALIYPDRSMPKLLQMVLILGIVLIALVSLHHRGSTMRRYAGSNSTDISVTFRHSSEAGRLCYGLDCGDLADRLQPGCYPTCI